jgi:transposase
MLVPQPPYSPDLAPVDFFLFNKLKSVLEGWKFESVQVIKENLLAELTSIPEEVFQEYFQNWKKRWERCI